MKARNKIFRNLLRQKKLIRLVGAHDGLTAKIGEKVGFDGIWASGLEISTSFAVPDANILTMSQYLERACEMHDAVSIPIMADCDTGYGNSNNVMHMVRKYEASGISAVCIEDKKFPKVNSFIPGRQELASVSEFVGKIMAAKTVQEDPNFMLVARVEALVAGYGIDEAIRRANAYKDAGADAILIHSKQTSPDEIFEFARRWKRRLPLVIVPTTYYKTMVDEFNSAGIDMVIYANHGIRSAVSSIEKVLSEIYDKGSTHSVEDKIAPMSYIFELQGMNLMKEHEKNFLHGDRERVVAVIPAAGDHLEEDSMRHISAEIPISMLDVNGKPLLQRQMETLNKSFISEIYVVGGYKRDSLDMDGVRLLENIDYKNTGILYSIMCAEQYMDTMVFISYGDVYFENVTLELLLKSPEDITLLVDSGFKEKHYEANKALDLVIADIAPIRAKRKLIEVTTKKVKKIGMQLNPEEAHFEFPGLMVLSKKGVEIFKNVYRQSETKYAGKPFQESETFEKANLADLLQEVIDQGYLVSCIEVDSGWLEIHSFDDYKMACSLIQ